MRTLVIFITFSDISRHKINRPPQRPVRRVMTPFLSLHYMLVHGFRAGEEAEPAAQAVREVEPPHVADPQERAGRAGRHAQQTLAAAWAGLLLRVRGRLGAPVREQFAECRSSGDDRHPPARLLFTGYHRLEGTSHEQKNRDRSRVRTRWTSVPEPGALVRIRPVLPEGDLSAPGDSTKVLDLQ